MSPPAEAFNSKKWKCQVSNTQICQNDSALGGGTVAALFVISYAFQYSSDRTRQPSARGMDPPVSTHLEAKNSET